MILFCDEGARAEAGFPRASGGDPVVVRWEVMLHGFPRASGGDPKLQEYMNAIKGFSPRKRG